MMDFIEPHWPAPANVRAFTTLRHHWGSQESNPKDPQTRQTLKTIYHLPNEPIWVNQTHSTIALEAIPDNVDQTADASYTNQTDRICVVLTADCLPILICDKQGTNVAAIHAGWRGLAGGIIESTLDALNVPSEDLLVWMGPAIGPQKFEVGRDVYQAFTQKHAESTTAFTATENDKWLANLYQLARIRLNHRGITQIFGGDFCTYTQEDLFFSYRRDQGQTGRLASLIWINSSSDKK